MGGGNLDSIVLNQQVAVGVLLKLPCPPEKVKRKKRSWMNKLDALPRAVRWENRTLKLLDQRKLPQEESTITCHGIEDVFDGIKTLSVRGAPAIGIAAAYGLLAGLFERTMRVQTRI